MHWLLHYLDDFLLFGAPGTLEAASAAAMAMEVLANAGIPVEEWSRRHSCTRKELESFIGHLAHAATVIHPGKIFLRSLFCLLAGVHKPHHFVCVNAAIRADLQWWSYFLQVLNGTSFFPPLTPSLHVY